VGRVWEVPCSICRFCSTRCGVTGSTCPRTTPTAHEIYHDDAVLEFPQSSERFEGVANFKEWRSQYPADVRFRVRRIIAREELVVAEATGRGRRPKRRLTTAGMSGRDLRQTRVVPLGSASQPSIT
jgi:hypothetical protein